MRLQKLFFFLIQRSATPPSFVHSVLGKEIGFTFLELFLSLDSDDKCVSLAPRLS